MSDENGNVGTGPRHSLQMAKNSSLFAQIAAAVWIAGWHVWKFLQTPLNIDSGDIVVSGLTIAACFTPVYFNMVLDKIKGRNNGG